MLKLGLIHNSHTYHSLDDIFEGDDTGLLDNVKATSSKVEIDDVIRQKFEAIKAFVAEHGHVPSPEGNLQERLLAKSLVSILSDEYATQPLLPQDTQGLLASTAQQPLEPQTPTDTTQDPPPPEYKQIDGVTEVSDHLVNQVTSNSNAITSLDDIFNNDDLGFFDDINPEILKPSGRASPDKDRVIANRMPCEDFEKFQSIFEEIHDAIDNKQFHKASFTSINNIKVGSIFVINGLLGYVAAIDERETKKYEKTQNRLRLIFTNGTESNMLARSLATSQYKYDNSYEVIITKPGWHDQNESVGDDKASGVVYVARLINTPSELRSYNTLHKIGFSINSGSKRTERSTKDTAFLMNDVEIVSEWQIIDANAQGVEAVLHAFFSDYRINLSLLDDNERLRHAKEWFDIPLPEIEKAINLIIHGEINNYKIDEITRQIKPKGNV